MCENYKFLLGFRRYWHFNPLEKNLYFGKYLIVYEKATMHYKYTVKTDLQLEPLKLLVVFFFLFFAVAQTIFIDQWSRCRCSPRQLVCRR